MAAVSVSSCDSILEDDSLPVSNENIEISFTRSSENTVSLNDNGTFKVAFFTGVNYNFYAATDNLSGIEVAIEQKKDYFYFLFLFVRLTRQLFLPKLLIPKLVAYSHRMLLRDYLGRSLLHIQQCRLDKVLLCRRHFLCNCQFPRGCPLQHKSCSLLL